MKIYFSDFFKVTEQQLVEYGAFNISLITDLPLFIDPFLLFNSDKSEYQFLHNNILEYLRFLKKKSTAGQINDSLLKSWYYFSEVKQNWLGFCQEGNSGRGLGKKFASALNYNFHDLFLDFGSESITKGTHLEKLCLIEKGVGRDMISDFTTNLIKYFLLTYTEKFAKKYIDPSLTTEFAVSRVKFNYDTETWCSQIFVLPNLDDDYIILTPKDILTKDDNWINKIDLIKDFKKIPNSIGNDALRGQINNYFKMQLPRNPKKKDYEKAAELTIKKFPRLIDYYIRYKENNGDLAKATSASKVIQSYQLYIKQFQELPKLLSETTEFYKHLSETNEETLKRIEYLKDVIENKGGHKIFYFKGKPIRNEKDLHILYKLTWFASPSDVSREVDDGRGPADFKISRGSQDKTIVEFKLASNTSLKRNLKNQGEIYQKASDAKTVYKVILFFTRSEYIKVIKILKDIGLDNDPKVILIDAGKDNKPSGSKA